MSENFRELKTEEEFDAFVKQQHDDDDKLREMFNNQGHRAFQYSLINIGVMLDIVRGYFYFEKQKLEENIIKLEKDKVKNRRVNSMLKELNQKINLRFELDEDTVIIPSLVIYEDEGYLMINKTLFAQLLIEKAKDADIFL